MNRVTSTYMAIVDGKRTGLAGCTNQECGLQCLRKDRQIAKYADLHKTTKNGCGHRIPT